MAEHAQWCRRFASVNATGLRKIAKKHDKYAQNDAGKQFVQVRLQKLASDPLLARGCHAHTSSIYTCAVCFYRDPTGASICCIDRSCRSWDLRLLCIPAGVLGLPQQGAGRLPAQPAHRRAACPGAAVKRAPQQPGCPGAGDARAGQQGGGLAAAAAGGGARRQGGACYRTGGRAAAAAGVGFCPMDLHSSTSDGFL